MTRARSKSPAKADGQKIVAQPRRPGRAAKFDEVLALIDSARRRAYQAVNSELVGLYWELGAYIGKKIASAEWGDGVVDELAATIAREYPSMRGYTRPNLFRMRQFYEVYRADEKVAPLVRQLPWTHHLIILGQTKVSDERHLYMLAAVRGRWTKRELERQIRTGAALRGNANGMKFARGEGAPHATSGSENALKTTSSSPRSAPAQRIAESRGSCSAPFRPPWFATEGGVVKTSGRISDDLVGDHGISSRSRKRSSRSRPSCRGLSTLSLRSGRTTRPTAPSCTPIAWTPA